MFSVFAQTMTKVKGVVMMNFKGLEGVPRYAWQELAGQRPGTYSDVQCAVSSMIGAAGSILPRLAAETWGKWSSRKLMSL